MKIKERLKRACGAVIGLAELAYWRFNESVIVVLLCVLFALVATAFMGAI